MYQPHLRTARARTRAHTHGLLHASSFHSIALLQNKDCKENKLNEDFFFFIEGSTSTILLCYCFFFHTSLSFHENAKCSRSSGQVDVTYSNRLSIFSQISMQITKKNSNFLLLLLCCRNNVCHWHIEYNCIQIIKIFMKIIQ